MAKRTAKKPVKRRCTGTTKAGKPCKATPRRDTGTCNAHAPKEIQESAGFGGSQPGAGRPRAPRPSEVAQQLVERHITAVLRPYFRALGLELDEDGSVSECEGPIKYVWAGSDEPAVPVLDLGAQINASERLQDRIYGKPRQQLEHTGEGGGPIQTEGTLDLRALSDEDLAALEEIRARAAERS